jgi:hypothetical protein
MSAVVPATYMNVMQRNDAEAPTTAQGSKARAEQHEREMKMQAKNEAILGNIHNVRTARAKNPKIRNNKVFDTSTEEGKKAAAAWRIQLFARAFKHRKTKCHRENLGARLIFEDRALAPLHPGASDFRTHCLRSGHTVGFLVKKEC